MKKLTLLFLGLTAFITLSACRTDRDDRRGPYIGRDHHDDYHGPVNGGPVIDVNTEGRRD